MARHISTPGTSFQDTLKGNRSGVPLLHLFDQLPDTRTPNRIAFTTIIALAVSIAIGHSIRAQEAGQEDVGNSVIGIADPALRLYWPREKLCGAIAAHVALRDHGISSDFATIARELPACERGTSMQDCSSVIMARGLTTTCISTGRIGLESLLRNNPSVGAIVLVDGNHWVYVRALDENAFLCFDYPRWFSDREFRLFDRFSGPAIVIGDDATIRQLYLGQIVWWVSVGFAAVSIGFLVWVICEHCRNVRHAPLTVKPFDVASEVHQ